MDMQQLPSGIRARDALPQGPAQRSTRRARLTILYSTTLIAAWAAGTPATAQMTWQRVGPERPSGRYATAVALDTTRQRIVMFGGARTWQQYGDTWEWDGSAWQLRSSTGPAARQDHAIAFDQRRGRTLLYGGSGAAGNLGDAWEWDGTSWRRVADGPGQRHRHAMAYDPAGDRVVLFGGAVSGQGLAGDTWEWDGSAWTRRNVAGPAPRAGHAMVWDDARGRIVLFGGDDPGHLFADTWEWDGTAWQQLAATGPTGRRDPAMAYDPTRQRVVLHGGRDGSGTRDDTWEWDGVAWAQRTPPTGPGARHDHAAAFDPTSGEVVLFGGAGSQTYRYLGDTWSFDGTAWTRLTSPAPDPESHLMAYDTGRDRLVLVGSSGDAAETWEWDGARWSRNSGPEPGSSVFASAIAHDPVRGRTVLLASPSPLRSTVWEWDGSTWSSRPPTSGYHGAALAYHGGSRRVVLFGGETSTVYPHFQLLADTLEWNGASWLYRYPTRRPPARKGHAMAYDAARDRIVLFGGDSVVGTADDTWEWDGSEWTERQPAQRPPARSRHRMVYDAARERIVLFGGSTRLAVALDDAWEWDGDDWRPLPAGPSARFGHAMAYDATREQVLMFSSENAENGDLWALRPTVRGRSAVVGAGCAGSRGVPTLAASGPPILGNSRFGFRLESLRSSAPVAVWIALSGTAVPIGGGCSLYVADPVVFLATVSSPSGSARLALPIPISPALRGVVVPTQAVVMDPGGAYQGLAAVSAGLYLLIGD